MSAAIVYEGVRGEYEGTLFNGLKFFIQAQVPNRNNLVEQIKDNGGKIVLLEDKADIRIGDHLIPKRSKPGAVSFKYIRDCIAEGTLCNIQDPKYQVHAPPTGRPGVSSNGTKKTRNPFTPEEDAILVKHVVDHQRAGNSTKGNKIYEMLVQKLIDENSIYKDRHTAQSWRDRWVKKFEELPFSSLEAYLQKPEVSPAPNPARVASSQVQSPQVHVARQIPSVPASQQRNDAPKTRVKFTEEEDNLLLEYVAARVRAGEKALGNKIYLEFAEEYPRHSYQSWLNRYKLLQSRSSGRDQPSTSVANPDLERQMIAPRRLIDLTRDSSAVSAAAPRQSGSSAPRISTDHMDIIREFSQPLPRPTPSRIANPSEPSTTDILRDLSVKDNMHLVVVKTIRKFQSTWRANKVRQNLRPEQPRPRLASPGTPEPIEEWELPQATTASPTPVDKSPAEQMKVKTESDDAVTIPDPKDGVAKDERAEAKESQKFYGYLKAYQKWRNMEHSRTAEIAVGREKMALSLWDLWDKTRKHHLDHSSRNWKAIAEAFEISHDAADQLQSAFEKHLLGFEDMSHKLVQTRQGQSTRQTQSTASDDSDVESDEVSSDDEEETDSPTAQIQGTGPAPAVVNSASTGPPVTGTKRPISLVDVSSDDDISNNHAPKRRRYKSTDEIPCSPELTRQVLVAAPERALSPQLLPARLRETTKETTAVLPSIERDLAEPTSDSDSDAFDPPAAAPEPHRLALPKSWEKPAGRRSPTENSDGNPPSNYPPSSRSVSSAVQRPHLPPQRQPPPPSSTSSVSAAYAAPNRQVSQQRGFRGTASTSTPSTADLSFKKPDAAVIEGLVGLGYDEDTVLEALEATTNDVDLAKQVLDLEGIPTNLAGVWTPRDDRSLKKSHELATSKLGGDLARVKEALDERNRIIKKHTRKKCIARAKYLSLMPWA